MTVLDAIRKSTEFLAKKNVESARLQAELLLAHLLKLPRMRLYLNFDRELSSEETDALRELIRRRGLREPLQHIVGSTSFCGLEIAVGRQALIPRPETELLAELGWQFLQRAGKPQPMEAVPIALGPVTADRMDAKPPVQAMPLNPQPIALDFGTGTGCIAIALAAKCPDARITALEVSAEALELARQNARHHGVASRIDFLQGDGFAVLADKSGISPQFPPSFDLIISNPPYIPSAEIATLEPEVRDFDPRLALDGGADGLEFYRKLAAIAKPLLGAGGRLMLEFGDGQAEAIKTIFTGQKWVVETVQEDYSQRARILVVRHQSLEPANNPLIQ